MRLTKIFFIVLLLLFPFGELFRLSIGNATAHVTDVVLAVLIPLWIFDKISHSGIFFGRLPRRLNNMAPRNDIQSAIALFIGILVLSLAIHIFDYGLPVLASSFLYTVRFACYALLYPIVFGFPKAFKNTVLKALVFSGGVIVMLGFVQYFLYPDLRNLYYAGWDEHLYRMFSTFLDPNFAGTFFVCYFLFVLHLFLSRFRVEPGMTKWVYGVLCLLTFIAIILTYSRGAYIMLFVSLGVYVIARRNDEAISFKKIATPRWVLGLAMTIGIVAIGLLFFLSPRSEGTNLLRTTSGIARLGAVQNAVSIWQDNMLFGVGFNAYRYAQEKHGFIKPKIIENHAAAGTDNSFLFVLATTGIAGLTAYLYMWYKILKSLHVYSSSEPLQDLRAKAESRSLDDDSSRLRLRSARTINVVVVSTLVGLFVNAFFVNSLFFPAIMLWVWILLGLTDST